MSWERRKEGRSVRRRIEEAWWEQVEIRLYAKGSGIGEKEVDVKGLLNKK